MGGRGSWSATAARNDRANPETFFFNTSARFVEADTPDRDPDYESASGSRYWYTNDGVYRRSDHWGTGIASCSWQLGSQPLDQRSGDWDKGERTGFAKWSDFKLRKPEANLMDGVLVNRNGRMREKTVFSGKTTSISIADVNRGYTMINGKRYEVRKSYDWFELVNVR